MYLLCSPSTYSRKVFEAPVLGSLRLIGLFYAGDLLCKGISMHEVWLKPMKLFLNAMGACSLDLKLSDVRNEA